MSRKKSFLFKTRSNAAERSRKSRQHLRVESLEQRDLLTTLSVDIADSDCATEGDHNYCQIQDAIDAADEGDVIEVASGSYETIQIRTDNLTLRAVEGDAPKINARGELSAVGLHANGVTVHGFAVEDALRGFDVTGDSNTLSANHANNIGLTGDGFRAAFFVNGGEANTFSGNTAENVRMGFQLVDSHSNTLENNHVGTALQGYILSTSDSNTLRQNTSVNSALNGFVLWADCDSNILVENTAEGNGHSGIAVLSGRNNTIERNIARGNRWGMTIVNWDANTPPPESNIVDGNTAEGNTAYGFGLGGSDSNTYRGNAAKGNGGSGFVIVTEFGNSRSNLFEDNIAIGNGGFAFNILEADDNLANTFENNRCVENASGAASHDVASCSLPAPGDANLDGVFNSTDLIQIFQAGQYEDTVTENSTWRDGDWNGDGEFDTGDLVMAFQHGVYSAAASAAAMPGSLDLNADVSTQGRPARLHNELQKLPKLDTPTEMDLGSSDVEAELAHRDSLFQQICRQTDFGRGELLLTDLLDQLAD